MKLSDFQTHEHPLKAWLHKKQRMIIVLGTWTNPATGEQFITDCIYPGSMDGPIKEGERIWVYQERYAEQARVSKEEIATLLHPTGVPGKRVCEKCYGKGKWQLIDQGGNDTRLVDCLICGGAGDLPAMIYEGDVLFTTVEYEGEISHSVGFVKRLSCGTWVIEDTESRNVEPPVDVEGYDIPSIVIGNVFEPDKIDWLGGITPEQKGWVVAEIKELKGSMV